MTSEKIKRGSLLVAYELNCNNRFDLDVIFILLIRIIYITNPLTLWIL